MRSEEINALPERVRNYIHDLETNCDPTGVLRSAICMRETAESLLVRIKEAKALIAGHSWWRDVDDDKARRILSVLGDTDPVESEVAEMFSVEEPCRSATHGPRNSRCTCEDSRDE